MTSLVGRWLLHRPVCTLSRILVLAMLGVVCSPAAISAVTNDDELLKYEVRWGQEIPTRDGVELNATVYQPAPNGAYPTILTITPYISDRYHADGVYFAQRGFVYVVADTRGRGNSEGVYEPFIKREARDGYDAIDWIVRQPWSNGKVAMRGGSYSGHNQWLTVTTRPAPLITIVPVASPYIGFDFPMRSNRPMVFAYQWRMFTDGATSNRNIGYDRKHWDSIASDLYSSGEPYAHLDSAAGMRSDLFQEWIAHPRWDEYWEARNPTDEELARVNLPVLTITGHYDGDQKGALELYRRHMRHAPLDASRQHYLIIGPWGHGGTRNPTKEVGGYTFGEKSVIDMKELDVAWYDWTMRGGDKPEFLKDRIAYFLAGANRWVYADHLDTIADSEKDFYLQSRDGSAGGVFAGGRLADRQSSEESEPDRYTYDAAELPGLESPTSWWNDKHLVDQTGAYAMHGNGVVYTSEPFPEATEITGNVRLDAWLELNVPDADFEVLLYEILPDGSAVLLTSDTMRARYRNGLSEEDLVEPGSIDQYVFDGSNFFSRYVAKGSRLRLILMAPASFDMQLNFNSGGTVADETIRDARTTTVVVHHSRKYPSTLTIPIVTNSAGHDTQESSN